MTIDNCKFSIRRRRGTAYVLVMGIALIVTVLGVGSLMAARSYQRATTAATDWEEAGTLAFSAAEQAVANLSARAAASPAGWRAGFTSGTVAFPATAVGRGTISWTLKDEVDGNLSADYLRPFRVYGVGVVNAVTRVYSVQVRPAGTPMDVLRTALHASGDVTLTGTVLAGTGPLANVTLPTAGLGVISSNAKVTLGPMLFANVESATVSGTAATRTGTNTVTAAKTMPATAWPTLVSTYAALATPLTVAKSGASNTANMTGFLLSPAVNPYGTTVNASGIYSLALTNTGTGAVTLTVTNARILGTLVVTAPTGAVVNISGPVSWQTAAPNLPALIVSGTNLTVNVTGSTTWLSESGMAKNFNPAGSPYDGVTDATTTEDYPPSIGGVVYVAGSGNTLKLSNTPCMQGTVICDGTAQVTGPAALAQNTATYASPPVGFAKGDAVAQVPGTWRWDALP